MKEMNKGGVERAQFHETLFCLLIEQHAYGMFTLKIPEISFENVYKMLFELIVMNFHITENLFIIIFIF